MNNRKIVIHLIAAARPNFMKVAPLFHALSEEEWALPIIVHTGQHYDINMSDAFFSDLRMPEPHIHLGVGSGSHAEQTAKVMMAYEKIILKDSPDLVIVVGDVNSTLACSLAASKLPSHTDESGRPHVAHLEAGLRSFDRTMPEEINRLVTDILADILWTPSVDADHNLMKEGIPAKKIDRIGNIMIDSLEMMRERIEQQDEYKKFGLSKNSYGIITFHRPNNVDSESNLRHICEALIEISKRLPLLFPVHPRTRKNLIEFDLFEKLNSAEGIILSEPLSYIRFMNLVFNCRIAITDSGGLQEETTYLGIPCITVRPNTERPITVTQGTNILCDLEEFMEKVQNCLSMDNPESSVPEFWDGKTAHRAVQSIKELFHIE